MELREIYDKYSNFSEYRNSQLQDFDEKTQSIRMEIQELELEKKQKQLEYDVQINELKNKVRVKSKSDRANLNANLNQEKQELRETLYAEISSYLSKGWKPQDLAKHLGLASTTLVYQAIKHVPVDKTASTEAESLEWHYFDNAAIHRYAVSDDGTRVKVHGADENYKIVDAKTKQLVEGDESVKSNSKRIDVALKMFNGTYERDYIEKINPYRKAAGSY